jgi:hypothetical protein
LTDFKFRIRWETQGKCFQALLWKTKSVYFHKLLECSSKCLRQVVCGWTLSHVWGFYNLHVFPVWLIKKRSTQNYTVFKDMSVGKANGRIWIDYSNLFQNKQDFRQISPEDKLYLSRTHWMFRKSNQIETFRELFLIWKRNLENLKKLFLKRTFVSNDKVFSLYFILGILMFNCNFFFIKFMLIRK